MPDYKIVDTQPSDETLISNVEKIERDSDYTHVSFRIVYSIFVVCLSTFFFGMCLTSSDFFMNIYNHNFMKKNNGSFMNDFMNNKVNGTTPSALTQTETSLFLSLYLLGALGGNIVISSFHFNRKLVILLNNIVYLVAVITMGLSFHSVQLIVGKFILGVASGISCAYVPAYLTELKIYRWSGLIGCFQSVLVTLGVLCGYMFENFAHDHRLIGFIVICAFLVVHSLSLIFVLNTKSTRDSKNIISLFKNKESWKSIMTCSLFHLTQQASGVNVVLMCTSKLLQNTNANKNSPVYVGLSQFLANIVAMCLVDKVGRKPLMIISVAGAIVSLAIMAFSRFVEIGMYIFMIFFSFGLGPITWFITGELVPIEYRDATNLIATSINWFSSFLALITEGPLFKLLGSYLFAIYLGFMVIYGIYLIFFFKETRGRIPFFLK